MWENVENAGCGLAKSGNEDAIFVSNVEDGFVFTGTEIAAINLQNAWKRHPRFAEEFADSSFACSHFGTR